MLRTLAAAGLLWGAVASIAAVGVGRTGSATRVRRARAAVVHIPAGEFVMGAEGADLERARLLCAREANASDWIAARRCGFFVERGEALCTPARFAPEGGAHRVWLQAFAIDRTEVTVAQYDRCVQAGSCRVALIGLGTPLLGGATQPIVGVAWDDAATYCRWAGGRLPTEAEWERAARGRDRRPFPWGWSFDPRRANHGSLDEGCRASRDGHALSAPVGSYPDGASPDGVLDMAGNVWEWVADYWDPYQSLYPMDPALSRVDPQAAGDAGLLLHPRVSPLGASHGAGHIIRGGSYDAPAFALRTTYRGRRGSGERDLSLGFRCAYDEPR